MKPVIRSLRAEYVQIPLKNPFIISIRTALNANVVRWRLELSDGAHFLGECVPVQYVTGETPETALVAAPKLERVVCDQPVEHLADLIRRMQDECPHDVAARTGVEIALYNAYAASIETPLEIIFGGAGKCVTTDLTIARNPNAVDIAKAAWDEGFRTFKIKVGGGAQEEDIQRVTAIAHTLPQAVIRLDANQSLDVDGTLSLTERLQGEGVAIELIEQPVAKENTSALDEIARHSTVPIIADEACRGAEDAYQLFATTAVHGVNVKLMKSGISGALDIIRIAQAAKRKLMIGCMLESEVGMAVSIALACGTDAFDYIDLDGHLLLDLPEPVTLFKAEGAQVWCTR